MSKKRPKTYNPSSLVEAIKKWPNPLYDKKHDVQIYLVDDRARSNQSRIDHIVKFGHDLKARDLELVPDGIKQYFKYKKDRSCKDTYNYYLNRRGDDKGWIKVSIRFSDMNKHYAWIKTIFVTYKIK